MKWCNSLTIRYLRKNKKRTLVTLIGIVISVALMCGVMTIMSSYRNMEINAAIKDNGDYHSTFNKVVAKNKEYIAKDNRVDKYVISSDIGYYQIEGEEKVNGQIKKYESEAFKTLEVKLVEGTYPTREDEIIISEEIISNSYGKYKLGDEVRINIGDKTIDEKEISNIKELKKFKIIGISKRSFAEEQLAITYMDLNNINDNDLVNISVKLKDVKDIDKILPQMAEQLDMVKEKNTDEYNIENNESLLRLYGESKYENVNRGIVSIICIVISLIVLITVATIYNAFTISIVERKRQFGMLSSLGATERQIENLVIREAMIISIIAIPIGIIIGTLGVKLLFSIIVTIFNSSILNEISISIVSDFEGIIVGAIISLITIYLSVLLPARKASKTSPIDAIRNIGDFNVKRIKRNIIISKLFGIEGELAYKNLKRNKRKYRITLFSLIVSIIIFLSFSGITNTLNKANSMFRDISEMDFVITSENKIPSIQESILEKIENLSGVGKVYNNNFFITSAKLSESNINTELSEEIRRPIIEHKEFLEHYSCYINSIGNKNLKDIKLIDGNFNIEEAKKKNGVILLNNNRFLQKGKIVEAPLTNFKVGDKIYIEDYTSNGDIKEEFEIMAIAEEAPVNIKYGDGVVLITVDEIVKKIRTGKEFNITGEATINIIANNTPKAREELNRIVENDSDFKVLRLQLNDLEKLESDSRNFNNIIKSFIYAFIILISSISITNIINTINTNFKLRKKEFAMIESIGITPKGFKKMIYLESLYYTLFSMLYGVPLSLGIVYIMHRSVNDMIEFKFEFQYEMILIVLIVLASVCILSAYMPMKKMEKESIVDNIREENI